MKIAIISDSHDNLANLKKALDWIKAQGVEEIIHPGDVCAPSTLKELAQNFPGRIHLVFGNVDGDHYLMTKFSQEELKNITLYGEMGELERNHLRIAFTHYPKFARGLASTGDYDLVFYGHSHLPWEEKIGNCRLINPGTLGGMFNKATFALYETKTNQLELKILDKL